MAKKKTRTPIVAGNWKMNGLMSSKSELKTLAKHLKKQSKSACDVVICPPATLLKAFQSDVKGTRIKLGAQDCHQNQSGAHTGDVSAQMLADAGAKWIIVGHSERRTDHKETDALVCAKAGAAIAAGCGVIICVGETEAQRDKKMTLRTVGRQLKNSMPETANAGDVVIAYEPVWAIGTGRTPTNEEIAEVHGFIRSKLFARFGDEGKSVRILYGGSVKPANAREILAIENVDGGLVGGASLKAKDFWGIIKAYGAK